MGLAFLVQLMRDVEKLVLVDQTVSELAGVPESLAEHADVHPRLTASRRIRFYHQWFFHPRQKNPYKWDKVEENLTPDFCFSGCG